VRRGNRQAPVCTDCHGEHDILKHTDPASPVAAANVSARVCSPCHSSLKLSEKYGIASDRFKTFNDSYHGLAIRGGELQVANCASCHGAHAIKSSSDPTSTVNKANLAATCGKCHPGANNRFAIGEVHLITAEPEHPALYWVATAYVGLIILTITGMVLHNLLDFLKRSRRRLRIRRGLEPAEEYGRASFLRMTRGERIQHATLLTSFFTLVITGFMLRYPDAWWVVGIRRLSSHAFEYRSVIHRIAGVTMVLAGLAHLYYLAFTRRGREFVRDIFPVPGDATEMIRMVGYNLGLTRRHPEFGRFSYIEKSEYWAVVWGTVIMGATGAILWFENTFIRLFTKLGYDVARTIHFYEAWLAFLAILVWHLYWVLLNPDTYPMNSAWLTGALSEEEMAAEHPRELAEIRRRQAEAELAELRRREPEAEQADGEGPEADTTPRVG
jgi:cytochrome b subunit of formate dehydrogenase